MLDAALLALLDNPPLPPAPPPIATEESRSYPAPAADAAERRLKRTVEAFAQQSQAFKSKLRELVLAVENSAPTWDVSDFDKIGELVSDTEALAEQRAIVAARTEKQERGRQKKLFERSPAVGALHRTFVTPLFAIERENIEQMLEFALFLRAFRADHDPDARGGTVFDDAVDLRHFLDASIA